jgi:phosphatidylinositol glycan class B
MHQQHIRPTPSKNRKWEHGLRNCMSRANTFFFVMVVVIGFALRLSEAVQTADLAHPDEIFQTLEPAHRLAYGYGVVSWEWRDGIRSWVFPTFLAGVMKATGWMSRGSTGYVVGVRILLSIVSMVTVWFGFVWARRADGTTAAMIGAAACAIWYEIIGFAPRAMTEVVATHILLVGLYLGVYSEWLQERRRLFLAALLCGIALSLRIQLAPAVFFAGLYFCRGCWQRRLSVVMGGILLPVCAFGLVDAFTWGHAFQSFYLYFWENAIQGKSLRYGEQPWYWYLMEQMKHLGPVALLALVGIRRSAFLGWMVLIILASHSLLGHKEVRFLYPILPFVIVLSAIGFVEIAKEFTPILKLSLSPRAVVLTGVAFFALFSLLLSPQFSYRRKDSGSMRALTLLSKDRNVCGVGLYGVPWFETGGYTYLHQNIPIILVLRPDQFDREESTFNAVVAREDLELNNDFILSACWNGECLYRRAGSCTLSTENEINTLLQQNGN